ncbi:MAG: hypothetical protein ABI795_06775 [Chthoniobacterales bacterium]
MRKTTLLVILCGCALLVSAAAGYGRNGAAAESFTSQDARGKTISASLAGVAEKHKLTSPIAHVDPALDPKLTRAATIAQERANAHSKSRCWHYVKDALVASGVVASRPATAMAKQAGDDLVRNYGFKKLPISDPFAAPVGAVLVYNASGSAGHVEIRTEDGFASDFRAKIPSRRPLIGIYGKA